MRGQRRFRRWAALRGCEPRYVGVRTPDGRSESYNSPMRVQLKVRLAAILSGLLASTPSVSAQECPPLTPGDTVRVTQTFWTLRPEYGIETRSQHIEFGRVTELGPDSIAFEGSDGPTRLGFADSVSVARLCRVRIPSERDMGHAALGGAITGGLLGAGVASCEFRNTFDWWEESDCESDAGDVLLGVAIGGVVGLLIGVGWAAGDRGTTEWGWVDGTGGGGHALALAVSPGVAPGSWSVAIRLPGR